VPHEASWNVCFVALSTFQTTCLNNLAIHRMALKSIQ